MQAIRGTREQTTPVVDTAKYFMAVYAMKIETQVWHDLKASANLLSGSIESYMMCLSLKFSPTIRMMSEMSAFRAVT